MRPGRRAWAPFEQRARRHGGTEKYILPGPGAVRYFFASSTVGESAGKGFVKKSNIINNLAKAILGVSLILGGCAAIFVGVAGGFRSPLSASADAGAAETNGADTHSAGLLRAASFTSTSSTTN